MIHGLITPRLMETYKIKIGIKGETRSTKAGSTFMLPQKLDHFKIFSNERDVHGRLIEDPVMSEIITAGGTVKPKELDIQFLYNDIEQNFATCLAYFAGTSCVCRGDGKTAMRYYDGPAKLPEPREIPCPCDLLQPDGKGARRCKPNGRLVCLLSQAKRYGGSAVFRTTSWNTINNILSSLTLLHETTGGVLAGIPFKMVLAPKTVQTPDGKPMRAYVVNIEYDGPPQWLIETGLKYITTMTSGRRKVSGLLGAATVPFETDEGDIIPMQGMDAKELVEEFYPDNLGEMEEAIKEPEPMPRRKVASQPETKEEHPEPDWMKDESTDPEKKEEIPPIENPIMADKEDISRIRGAVSTAKGTKDKLDRFLFEGYGINREREILKSQVDGIISEITLGALNEYKAE